MGLIKSFRELEVYKLALVEAKKIFLLTKSFPKDEIYSMSSQIRRSSRAVSAMIAESWARRIYPAAFVSKLDEALGEAMETQAWLDNALNCHYIDAAQHSELNDAWQHIGAMLNKMIHNPDGFCKSAIKK
jgi:four helix bundle protein